jgi:tRNA-dihydrouridine synthase B
MKYWYKSGEYSAGAPARETADPSRTIDGTNPAASAAQRPFPAHLQIGGVQIRPATVLAPMAGVTDTVFRRFIKNLGGCGLIMTEFTSADGVLRSKKTAGRYLHFYEDEHPISAQLFGSSPQVLADAARLVEGLGFDLVDLNLGCPAKKVVKCNGGSGLLRDLPLIRQIFESVRAAVRIPFTVKFRAGWSDDEIVCVELARIAEDCGLGAVALHARTRQQGYSGNARWEWIASVKQAVKIPVIGNGDIRSPEDAVAMVSQTGCDAVMIGRMAPANPWIFRQIEQYVAATTHVRTAALGCPVERSSTAAVDRRAPSPVQQRLDRSENREGHDFSRANNAAIKTAALAAEGKPYDEPTESDRYQMIRTYFQMLLEEEMPDAVGKMKQFASWFTHGVPGGAALRKAIYDSKTGPEILQGVEEFFEAKLQSTV